MSQQEGAFDLNTPVPYKLHVDDKLLSITKQRLTLTRYPDELSDVDDDD